MNAVPPKPAVTVEAEPFIPYVKREDFDPRIKPILDLCISRFNAFAKPGF